METAGDEQAQRIVAFWLGRALRSPRHAGARKRWWYRGGATVDAEIDRRFGTLVPEAIAGRYEPWRHSGVGCLALVLLLDQFTRNLYRHTPKAYAGDARAFDVLEHALAHRLDAELHPVERIWLYHPLHHSESLPAQDRGVALLTQIADALAAEPGEVPAVGPRVPDPRVPDPRVPDPRGADPRGAVPEAEWAKYVRRSAKAWRRHRDTVARFGRFPHRNAVLGRPSTAAELAYLAESSDAFGQGQAPGAEVPGARP